MKGREGNGARMSHRVCEEQSHIPLSNVTGRSGKGGVPCGGQRSGCSPEFPASQGELRQSLGAPPGVSLRFALTLKKLLQVKLQEPLSLPLQATVLPSPWERPSHLLLGK